MIGAFIAEMDFGAAPPIQAALCDALGRADFGYLSDHAAAELADACARWQADRYGWAVNAAWIRPLADVISGLRAAIALYSEPGSPVILPTPAYMPFLKVPASMGREIIQVPMITGAGGRAVLDLAGLDAAFRRGGHLLVLCNPCNPVGRVYQAAELAAVAAVVAANNGRVFADEVHAPLIYPGGVHVPYASIGEQAAAHTVTATSASKGWNLPGLKCAQLIFSNHRDAEAWSRDAYAFEHGASVLGVRASTAAYRDGGPWLAEVVEYLDEAGCCWPSCSVSSCPQFAISRPRAPTWPGSTAGPCFRRRSFRRRSFRPRSFRPRTSSVRRTIRPLRPAPRVTPRRPTPAPVRPPSSWPRRR